MTLRNACINYVQLCYFLFLLPSFPPFPALSGVTVVTFPRPCLLHFWLLRLSLHLWRFLLGSTRRGCLDAWKVAAMAPWDAMGLRKSHLETSHLETYPAHVRRFGMFWDGQDLCFAGHSMPQHATALLRVKDHIARGLSTSIGCLRGARSSDWLKPTEKHVEHADILYIVPCLASIYKICVPTKL